MSKTSNILLMLKILSDGRKHSIKELSNTLEVTPRMIRIYKEDLEKAQIYVDTIRGPYGGYILNQTVYIPKQENKEDKLKMSDLDKKIYNIINKALKERKKVLLTYLSSDNTIKKRVIQPMDLYVYSHNWYIPAYCEYRKSMRHFQFKNIKDLELLNEKY